MSRLQKAILLIVLILVADQVLKIWVKTHMVLGESIPVFGNWFYLSFTENPGAAFGTTFGGDFGKLALSLFRIIMASIMAWYLPRLAKNSNAKTGIVLGLAAVLAGAVGNIIDSAFYGLIFSDSIGQIAEIFPPGGGYAPFLHGHVVDMFFFPIIEGTYPSWFPFWAGEDFLFFRFIFNIADSAVCVSVTYMFIFQRKSLNLILERQQHKQQ